jgi:diguanylate cyclase (GGDEF)-like protein/PAS domain S-box-containing protein
MKGKRRKRTVLLIEPDQDEAELVRLMLSEAEAILADSDGSCCRYQLAHESQLQAGMALLQQERFDVALVAVESSKNGYDGLTRLQSSGRELPIIALVREEEASTAAAVVSAGGEDYLLKRRADGMAMVRAIELAIGRRQSLGSQTDSQSCFELAVRGADDGILDWDLSTAIVSCCRRTQELLGVDGSFSTARWFDNVHPDDLGPLKAALEDHFNGKTERLENHHRIHISQKGWRWVMIRGTVAPESSGKTARLVALVSDVTDRKQTEEQLLHDAFHDSLTGLANRALFIDRLEQLIVRCRRRGDIRFAVLFFDLDGFKSINDSFGHGVGDQMLVAIARRMERSLRPMDAIARFGGDELAVLINDTVDLGGAVHVAERIQGLLAEGFEIDGHRLAISASIGIVLNTNQHKEAREILREADIAMYRAKAAGKAQYAVFDRDMHRSAVALLSMEQELRRAVTEYEFVMYYQPIVSLATGKLVGFEGLVRWQHPQRGLITPAQFIAVAEESGVIVPLGWWVLRESCRQIRTWQRRYPTEPPLTISVNISRKLFMQADMVDRVVAILEETALHPESLRIEIRENTVVDDESAIAKLLELRGLGVRVSVDDFGTGYSSLSYLRRFRCESVKIDTSFVSRINQAGDSRNLVETILTLADTMGLGVIAEGVETADQLDWLREMHCPHGQGYWFAKPLPADAAEQLITSPSW